MIHALHGNLGGSRDWEETAAEWGNVDAVDLWSWQEGGSGISLTEFGERFSERITVADPDPVLVGYSLGGRLALHALAVRPECWRAVILVSTHPGLESESERASRLRSDREWAERVREEDWKVFLRDWNRQPVLRGQSPSPTQAALVERREAVARAFEHWSLGSQQPMERQLEQCDTPLLVVHGANDERFAGLAARMKHRLPSAEVRSMTGAGHRLLTECPRELGRVVRGWLEGLSSKRVPKS